MMKKFISNKKKIIRFVKYADEISMEYSGTYEVAGSIKKVERISDKGLIPVGNKIPLNNQYSLPSDRNIFGVFSEMIGRKKHTFPAGRDIHAILVDVPVILSRVLPVLSENRDTQSEILMSHPDVPAGNPEVYMTGTDFPEYKPGFPVILYRILLTLSGFHKVLPEVPVEFSGLRMDLRNILAGKQQLPASQNSILVTFRSSPVLNRKTSVRDRE